MTDLRLLDPCPVPEHDRFAREHRPLGIGYARSDPVDNLSLPLAGIDGLGEQNSNSSLHALCGEALDLLAV